MARASPAMSPADAVSTESSAETATALNGGGGAAHPAYIGTFVTAVNLKELVCSLKSLRSQM